MRSAAASGEGEGWGWRSGWGPAGCSWGGCWWWWWLLGQRQGRGDTSQLAGLVDTTRPIEIDSPDGLQVPQWPRLPGIRRRHPLKHILHPPFSPQTPVDAPHRMGRIDELSELCGTIPHADVLFKRHLLQRRHQPPSATEIEMELRQALDSCECGEGRGRVDKRRTSRMFPSEGPRLIATPAVFLNCDGPQRSSIHVGSPPPGDVALYYGKENVKAPERNGRGMAESDADQLREGCCYLLYEGERDSLPKRALSPQPCADRQVMVIGGRQDPSFSRQPQQ
mmetsp:Transcript_47693/g.119273  ORF Transcript_47693/g.119273 Transcript_47693/m.119273 type:complete len:280 (-) Transcript_47693:346-1185(-)